MSKHKTFTGIPRTTEVSSIHFEVPKAHAEAETELEGYRKSGFHDPVQLRSRRRSTGYASLAPEGTEWDY